MRLRGRRSISRLFRKNDGVKMITVLDKNVKKVNSPREVGKLIGDACHFSIVQIIRDEKGSGKTSNEVGVRRL